MDNLKIGRFIAKKRKELGMTQQELANQLLVTNKAISKWETGAGIPDISILKDLSRVLKVTIDELLDGEEYEKQICTNQRNLHSFQITRKKYQIYLKKCLYQKRLYIILMEILGSFMLSGGFMMKSAYQFIGYHTDIVGPIFMISGFLIMLFPYLVYKIYPYFYNSKECQYELKSDGILYNNLGKESFYPYQYLKMSYEFDDFSILVFENEKLWIQKDYYGFIIGQLNCIKEKAISKTSIQKLFLMTLIFIIFLQFMVLELGYLIFMKKLGFEWIWNQLEWIIISGMMICLLLIILLKKDKIKYRYFTLILVIVFIFTGAIWLIGDMTSQEKTIYSLSHSFSHQLILKQDKESGEITDYHYNFLCFAKKKETFHASLIGDIQTQWITNDCNLVQYRDQQGFKQVFVATYGDRGSGISYYNTVGSMSGQWITKYNRDEDYKIDVVNGSITVSRGSDARVYSPYEIQQNGTIAVSLFKNNSLEYVIVLNENCELNENDLIKNSGTITIIPLTDGSQVPVELFCTTHKSDSEEEKIRDNQRREEATQIVQQMQAILKSDPTLEKLDEDYDLFKIETESVDYFEITRQAYLKSITYHHFEYSEEGQIQTITIPAGTTQDFYVKVKAEITLFLGNNQVTDATGYEVNYRIMKAEKGYLVCRISTILPGSIGLANLETPLEKDVSQNQNYYYIEE